MAARRSQFVDATEAPGLYYQDPRYIYHVPQTPLRNMAPAPIRLSEDYYNQMYPLPATPPTPYILNACCRGRSHSRSRRRRASRPSNIYDSDGSTDSYPSYADGQPTQQGADLLPPRIALRRLSDFLYEAAVFYNKQLREFADEHHDSGYTSNDALRQLLWKDWMNHRDDVTREYFTSTKTNTTTLFCQVEAAAETHWLEDPDIEARFNSTLKILQAMCDEIVRMADKAMSDWRTCYFLAVELNNARSYASPEGLVQRHLFSGWDKAKSW
ncbi:hypothetical protein FPOAC2_01011 [Fusarium poae]|uniref:Uncharacterized protein n=1 Tax=Fusarium poae TaxID=36050 RepID=A0A1B8B2L9_FUSPO|nr:hypothetical protein FPOAC1_000944 [Fusarium poae]KAG8674969.1 hypothetical protein FPOAC1_000944 [Fusarium poae]OBS26982.1 hypothetical protein FPOA_00923 [Fusarium poae]